jgi:cytochrome c5
VTATKNNEFSISLILVVALLLAVGLIYLFVFVMAEDGFGKNMERVKAQADTGIAMRIKPVVTLADLLGDTSKADQESQPVAAKSAKELFDGACMACHGTGVAGAPKLGDTVAWQPRFEVGVDGLLSSAIAGKGAMPPNGGTTYSEDEIRSVIEFMLSEAGLLEVSAAPAADPVSAAPAEAPAAAPEPASEQQPVASTTTPDLVAGEKAYRGVCFSCHDTGAAGAPKLGDKVAWAPRISTGFDALLQSAINGKNAMPAKGGASYLADIEVANIVAFMMDKAR